MLETNSTKNPPINLRELTAYLFLLTLLLAAASAFLVLTRIFQSQGDWHQIATVTEAAEENPGLHPLIASDDTRVRVWLAYANGTYRAYDGFTPALFNQHCQYGWQFVTNRFEDPCSGAKFQLDGTYIPEANYFNRPLATDLIQYRVELRDTQLWVNLNDKIKPSP